MDIEKILHEIDEMHQLSNEALVHKRFDDYINIFSDNLIYQQLNGKIIDKKQLTKDISSYFSRLKIATSHYERKDFSIEGNRVTETMIQNATASIRIFFFFKKNWTVEREGKYQWIKNGDNWKIEKMEVLNERVY